MERMNELLSHCFIFRCGSLDVHDNGCYDLLFFVSLPCDGKFYKGNGNNYSYGEVKKVTKYVYEVINEYGKWILLLISHESIHTLYAYRSRPEMNTFGYYNFKRRNDIIKAIYLLKNKY